MAAGKGGGLMRRVRIESHQFCVQGLLHVITPEGKALVEHEGGHLAVYDLTSGFHLTFETEELAAVIEGMTAAVAAGLKAERLKVAADGRQESRMVGLMEKDASRARGWPEPVVLGFDESTSLGQRQSWINHDHLQVKMRVAALETMVREAG